MGSNKEKMIFIVSNSDGYINYLPNSIWANITRYKLVVVSNSGNNYDACLCELH
jgi:hypothetical protein